MQFITSNQFSLKKEKKDLVPKDSQVIFVNDFFIEDLPGGGGAEASTEALIKSSQLNIAKVHSKDVTIDLLRDYQQLYWVFTNIANLDLNLIPSICQNIRYSVINYDYRFCKYRLIELHQAAEKKECDCSNDFFGKLISTFMYQADALYFMSEAQTEIWFERFPFLRDRNWTVLSSIFDEEFFVKLGELKDKLTSGEIKKNNKFLVLNSTSWVKGTENAISYCKQNNFEYEELAGLSYEKTLEKLAESKGLVYLPHGGDTCPRLVIEAKLLGCELIVNDKVQHLQEEWFKTNDLQDTVSYLYMARHRFWNGMKSIIEFNPTLSGYTTTRNCIQQNYPWRESIKSALGFCDEVNVLDGGSTDGTWEALQEWAKNEQKLKVKQFKRDWNAKRSAVFDGLQKALARTQCSEDFCWQFDVDEIVHESDYQRIHDLIKNFPKSISLLALPVIEYWGQKDKVRVDVMPWKWRLSRNEPHITHGIPAAHRRFDENGELYSLGSDGCDYIRSDTFEPIPCGTFYTQDIDALRQRALINDEALKEYTETLGAIVSNLPSVQHFSWWNIERKIKTYRDYWTKHWQQLRGDEYIDSADTNMFFDKPWKDVFDRDIYELAVKLKHESCGHIFHSKVDFSNKKQLSIDVSLPALIMEWCKANDFENRKKSSNK